MIRILIADDHAILRQGLKHIITDAFDPVVFGVAANVDETLACLREESWDILILDISMPGRSGFDVLDEVRRLAPTLPVLVLSSTPEDQLGLRAIRAGAAGYLNKQTAPELLVDALKKLRTGGRFISPQLRARLANEPKHRLEKTGPESLSTRELQVFHLTLSGRTVKEIATELGLSAKTISTFRRRIFEKFAVKNDVELLHYAGEQRLLSGPGTLHPFTPSRSAGP